MLVLSRRAGESIRISDDIVVSVQRVAGNRIVIGIEAPKDVSIRRGELVVEGDSAAAESEAEPQPASSRPVRRRNESVGNSKSDPRPRDRRGLGAAPLSSPLSAWSTAHIS